MRRWIEVRIKSRVCPFVPHERDGAVMPIGAVVSRYTCG